MPCIEFWDTGRTYDKFGCMFFMHGVKVGEGTGESKSNAKRAASEDALQELAPVIYSEWVEWKAECIKCNLSKF